MGQNTVKSQMLSMNIHVSFQVVMQCMLVKLRKTCIQEILSTNTIILGVQMETENFLKNHLFFNIKPVNMEAKRPTLKEKFFVTIKIVLVGDFYFQDKW